jgi:hypothetical protein
VPIEQPSGPAIRFEPAPFALDEDRTPVRRLEFVEVRSEEVAVAEAGAGAARRRARATAKTPVGAPAGAAVGPLPSPSEPRVTATSAEPRWSLWGDTDS